MTASKSITQFAVTVSTIVTASIFSGTLSYAQVGEVESAPGRVEITDNMPQSSSNTNSNSNTKSTSQTGRTAAQKYMGVPSDDDGSSSSRRPASSGNSEHYLAIHVGTFVSDDAYSWGGSNHSTDVGGLNAGVTYRIGEWVNSMDLAFRMDVSTFELPAGDATKISFLPVVQFPDANSRFPLYFGGGAGLGVMAEQVQSESALTFDYQLFVGARFLDLIETTGFFVETGFKNHVNLLTDGQFNGTFIALGAVFTF